MNRYLRVRVESGVPWPTKETTISFRGHDLTLFPETAELAPTVLLCYDRAVMTSTQAIQLVRHFLSSLSWVEGRPIQDLEWLEGGGPYWIGKGRANIVTHHFRADYLPDPDDPKARLALGLYREALYVNSLPYQVLGFFKIVNICYSSGPAQQAWINSVIDKVKDVSAKKRVQALREAGKDVGEYLYVSGRCAVAHASSDPIADPDSTEDMQRLAQDLPVIRALAEWLIEHELGVKSMATIWNEHLYELDGFRPLIGADIISPLKEGLPISLEQLPALPRLSLRVRGEPPMPAFEGLASEIAGVEGEHGCLVLRCRSDDGIVQLLPVLNFRAERLEFKLGNESQLFIGNDGSLNSVRKALDGAALIRGLLQNGQLEIWNTETGALLGRTDPYVPVNIDLTASIRGIDELIAELRTREQELLAASAAAAASTSQDSATDQGISHQTS